MKIGRRILVSKLVLVMLLIVAGVAQITLHHWTQAVLEASMTRILELERLKDQVNEIEDTYRTSIRSLYQLRSEDATSKVMGPPVEQLSELFRSVQGYLHGVPETTSVAMNVPSTLQAIAFTHQQLVLALASGDDQQTLLAMSNWNTTERLLTALTDDFFNLAAIRLRTSIAEATRWQFWFEIGYVAVLMLAGFYVFASGRHFFATIVRPIGRLNDCLLAFAGGYRDVEFEHESKDEIGELARNFEIMGSAVVESEGKLKETNDRLQRFAAVTAHDLRSPLCTATSLFELLEDGRLSPGEEAEICARIGRILRRSIGTVESLLKLSTDSVAETEFIKDPKDLVRDVLHDLSPEIQTSGARVKVGSMGPLTADPGLLRELLYNLVSNAIKHRRSEVTAEIHIRAIREHVGGRTWDTVVIKDNGEGIEESDMERILKPFERGTRRKECRGLGLGLAICNDIMRIHRGTLAVRSRPGVGSTFYARFPVGDEAIPNRALN